MRIVLFGQAAFAERVLDGLRAAGHEIAAIYCPPDQPGTKADPFKPRRSAALSIPAHQHKALKGADVAREVADYGADLGVLAYVTQIVPPAVFEAPKPGQHLLPPVAAAALSRRQRHSLADHQGRDAHRRQRVLGRSRHRHRADPPAARGGDRAGRHRRLAVLQHALPARRRCGARRRRTGRRRLGAAHRPGRVAGELRSALPRRARRDRLAASGSRGLQPHPRLRSAARRLRATR